MRIESLYINRFRCLEICDFVPAPGVNCIVGDNATGKTSVLESIYALARGQSFRQARLGQLIQEQASALTLRARLVHDDGSRHRIGAQITKQRSYFKIDEKNEASRYDLIQSLPLQHIDPNIHRLLEQGPIYRRSFLDWGVFHVEQAFFPAWRRYRRALLQRNRALRCNQAQHQVTAWDAELIRQGEIIDACRRRYLDHIQQHLPKTARTLLGDHDLGFVYQSGWRGDDGFDTALTQSIERDRRAGFTGQGPHRADLQITIAANKARDRVSRGQQKLLTAALVLAQAKILHEIHGVRPILLFDDMTAELGHVFQQALAREIDRIGAQCFITFLHCDLIPTQFVDAAVFHVEHGTLARI